MRGAHRVVLGSGVYLLLNMCLQNADVIAIQEINLRWFQQVLKRLGGDWDGERDDLNNVAVFFNKAVPLSSFTSEMCACFPGSNTAKCGWRKYMKVIVLLPAGVAFHGSRWI